MIQKAAMTLGGVPVIVEYEVMPGEDIEDISIAEMMYADGRKIPSCIQKVVVDFYEQQIYNELYADFIASKGDLR